MLEEILGDRDQPGSLWCRNQSDSVGDTRESCANRSQIMGELMVAIFDLIAVVAVCSIAWILYKKFVAPAPPKDRATDIAYEQGFNDAVKYFGLKKLYKDDPELKQRMDEVFTETGVPREPSHVSEQENQGNKRSKRNLG